MALVGGVAVLLYFCIRAGATPAPPGTARHVRPRRAAELELQYLVKGAGLAPAPTFLWNPLANGLPIVFGRRGRHPSRSVVVSSPSISTATGTVSAPSSCTSWRTSGTATSARPTLRGRCGGLRCGRAGAGGRLLPVAAGAGSLVGRRRVVLYRRAVDRRHRALGTGCAAGARILRRCAPRRGAKGIADRRNAGRASRSRRRRLAALAPLPSRSAAAPGHRQRPSELLRLGFADVLGIGIATPGSASLPSACRTCSSTCYPASRLSPSSFCRDQARRAGRSVHPGRRRGRNRRVAPAFSAELRDERPAKGDGVAGGRLRVAGGLPGLASMAVETPSCGRSSRAHAAWCDPLFLLIDVADYIVLLAGMPFVIFPWISQAASALVRRRCAKPVAATRRCHQSVTMALLLIVSVFGLATFAILFAVMVQLDGGDQASIYTYLLMVAPILVASVAAGHFPLPPPGGAAGRCTPMAANGQATNQQGARRLRAGSSSTAPGLGSPTAPCRACGPPCRSASTPGCSSRAFWELYFYRQLLPATIGRSIAAAFDVLFAWSGQPARQPWRAVAGDSGILRDPRGGIVAARARRLAELSGLFAAFVAGVVISAGNIVFFMEIGTTPADRTTYHRDPDGTGYLIAIGASIVAAWAGQGLRPTAYVAPVNSGVRWQSLVSNAGLVILALLVATGMGVRLMM